MPHAGNMKTRLLAPLILILLGASSSAEIYRSVAISELLIEGPKKEVAAAMDQQVDAFQLRMLDARLDGEAYLTMDDPEVGELPQNLMRIVFRSDAKLPIEGAIDLALDYSATKVKTFRFRIAEGSAKEIQIEEFEKARRAWADVRATSRIAGSVWFAHLADHGDGATGGAFDPVDMAETFNVFSGGRAIADNLALDRELILGGGEKSEKVRIDTIKGVSVQAIDWSSHLPDGEVALDPLALCIPEDQHVLFAPTLHGLLAVMERFDREAQPLLGMNSSESSYRGLLKRYRQQMGLDMGNAAASLLPVKSVAVTGGDPYFATGTDVAILMESDNSGALFKALELGVQARSLAKPQRYQQKDLQRTSFVVPEKGISSHVCRIGDLVFVTNSLAQVRRLSEVADQRAPALGKTEEFKVFRHRYPRAGEDAFAFLSDATIRRWAGPVTRIGASRRNRALAALNELTCRGLSRYGKQEDYSAMLGRVAMVNGRAISEHYGSAEFLTPISELGLAEVTQLEKEAYEQWRQGYERGWREVFDPIAIQLKLIDDSLDMDLTLLPLNINSNMQEVIALAGEATLSPRACLRPQNSILHLAFAIDSNSNWFGQFDQQLVQMMPDLKIKPLSWVGESVSIDLIDSLYWEGLGQMEMSQQLGHLPLVARVEVKSKLKLGLFLTAMRTLMQTTAPDTFGWINRKHGERSYVVIAQQDGDEFDDPFQICYAIVDKALLVALSERHLKEAMEMEELRLTEDQLEKLPMAKSLMIDADPAMLGVIEHMEGGSSSSSRLGRISRDAVPILNEWRRRFPDRDPLEVHQGMFGISIDCPGGRAYRWNEQHRTMESVAYGHRGAPREPDIAPKGLLQYGRMHSGIDFVDDGLRLRLHLGPDVDLPSLPEPKEGELLGKGVELLSYKPGRVLSYEGEDSFGRNSWNFEVTATEKTARGLRILSEEPWSDGEDKGKWMGSYLIAGDAIYQTGGKDEFGTTTYTKPPIDLPLELHANARHRYEAAGQDVYEENGQKEVDVYRERSELRVLGTDTVSTKAGEFKDCVVVERYTESQWSERFDVDYSKQWYHPGTGLVKVEDENGFGSELIKIEKK